MNRNYSHWGGALRSLIPLAFRQRAYGEEQFHYFPDVGLAKYGPLRTIERIRLIHVMTDEIKSYLNGDKEFHELLVSELEERLRKVLRVKRVEIDYKVLPSYDENFFNDLSNAIRDDQRAVILVSLPKKFMGRYRAKRYYYLIKAWCLPEGVIVQAYSDSTIRALTSGRNGGRETLLRNLALNIFAKAGGVPWGLREKDSVPYDIVMGLGWSFYRGTGRTGSVTKVFSQVHTFSEKGVWQRFYGKIAEYEHLKELITSSLKDALLELKFTKPKDYYRVLILSMKKLSSIEIKSILKPCDNLKKTGYVEADVEIVISQVSTLPGIRIYHKYSLGIPTRGIYFYLNSCTVVYLPVGLIESEEMGYGRPPKIMGTPIPLKIELLHPRKDILADIELVKGVCEVCHKFAIMNWRTIRGLTRLPSPLHYSKCISDFIKELKGLLNLDEVFIRKRGVIFEIHERLKTRPWFI